MKRMLFNATQAEELRVAIVDGQKLIDLDIESAAKEQRKSNIYKGVITRVEPSLEAAFVDYGAERHGFLPFKEISRSYFQPGVDAGRARINEAIKEGQELIVQVDKDERGNKGAALTTFISLAGRHLVLMPNNPRGGGVSRRVDGDERAELREAMDQLEVPQGMSLIARTAAIGRQVEELQWDLNYLLQLWRAIENVANENKAPLLIYQEGSLVIRAIRDYFQPEIGEILIDTDDIFEQAQAFMGQVMPGNVSRVKRYRDDVPLFSRFQIEHQIETAFARQVNLPSGGAIVIDHTEALVAVDVNSGRSTRGADIEETALKTNLEAADEIGRQLRLRDLGGLIVIDFIDMEPQKNQREVENRLKDALRFDRARVQMGKISRFGLMELSRQRLRPALAETSYIPCPRCTGTGHIRSTESAALHILRILEEESMKDNTAAVHVQVPVDVATFLLNEKRQDIQAIELRHKVTILLIPNKHLETPAHTITRLRHDDLNQDDLREPSYKMVDAPAEDSVKSGQNSTENGKPRQEAAIKHIAPAQPAPIVDPVKKTEATKAAKPGLLGRLVAWLTGSEKKAEEPAALEKDTKPRNERGNRRDNNRRDRGENNRQEGRRDRNERQGEPRNGGEEARQDRNGRQRNGRRDEKSEAPADEASRDNAPRNQRQERRVQAPRNGESEQRPVDATTVAADESQGRQPRERRPRRERQPAIAQDVAPLTETQVVDSASTGVDTQVQANTGDEANSVGNSRRRSRRGSRRGDRRNDGNNEAQGTDDMVAEGFAETPSEPADATPLVITLPATQAVAEAAVIERPSPIEASVQATPVLEQVVVTAETLQAPVAVAEPTPASETVVVPAEQAPVAPAETTPAVVEPSPVAVVPEVKLDQALSDLGLVMVTTTAAPVTPAAPEPAPALGRPRRPRQTLQQESLVMVETQKDASN